MRTQVSTGPSDGSFIFWLLVMAAILATCVFLWSHASGPSPIQCEWMGCKNAPTEFVTNNGLTRAYCGPHAEHAKSQWGWKTKGEIIK